MQRLGMCTYMSALLGKMDTSAVLLWLTSIIEMYDAKITFFRDVTKPWYVSNKLHSVT
jgi:hypothetical protein